MYNYEITFTKEKHSLHLYRTGHLWFMTLILLLSSYKIPYLEGADVAKASYLQILKTVHKIISI